MLYVIVSVLVGWLLSRSWWWNVIISGIMVVLGIIVVGVSMECMLSFRSVVVVLSSSLFICIDVMLVSHVGSTIVRADSDWCSSS